MTGKVTTTHGRKYTTYTCPNHKGGVCPTKDIQAKGLDTYVAAIVAKELISKSKISLLNSLLKGTNNNVKYKSLKNQLKGVEKRLQILLKVWKAGTPKSWFPLFINWKINSFV